METDRANAILCSLQTTLLLVNLTARSHSDLQLTDIVASNPHPVAPAVSAAPTVTLVQGGLPAAAQAQAGHAPSAAPNGATVVFGAVQAQQALGNVVAPPAQAPANNTAPYQPHTVVDSTIYACTWPIILRSGDTDAPS